jgi:hypothetical protein
MQHNRFVASLVLISRKKTLNADLVLDFILGYGSSKIVSREFLTLVNGAEKYGSPTNCFDNVRITY